MSHRGNHVVRRFTPEEDAQLIELAAEGLGPTEIGKRMGRGHNTIMGRLFTIARPDARNETQQACNNTQEI